MTRRNRQLLAAIPFRGLGPVVSGLFVLLASPAFASEGNLAIFPDTWMLPLIVLFVLLIFPADKLLFQPLLATLDERDKRIEGARQLAGEVARRADEVLAAYERSVDAARGDADSHRKERLAAAREELGRVTGEARGAAEEEVGRARQQVQDEVARARATLRQESQRLGVEAAARVLGRELA